MPDAKPKALDPTGPEMAWLHGPHTGLSSLCIWRTMVGVPEPEGLWRAGAYPLDPDDLWRCLRLLARFPEWERRIGEMAVHGPVWARLAEHWSELKALFIEEVGLPPKWGKAPKTYALMKKLENGDTDA